MNLLDRIEKLAGDMEDLKAILGSVPDRTEMENCARDYIDFSSLPDIESYSNRAMLYAVLNWAVTCCDFLAAEMEDQFARPFSLVDGGFSESLKREDTDGI